MIPKEKLYYTFESFLSKYHVFISNEEISNNLVYLDVTNGEVLLDNEQVATVEDITISPWIVMNELKLSSITISPLYRNFFPGKIDSLVVSYSIFHPLSVSIQGDGDFGHCNGEINLLEQKIKVIFDATSQMRRYPLLVSELHSGEGGLVYEDTF